jgi:hypothetical protein
MMFAIKIIARAGIIFLLLLPMLVPTVSNPRPVQFIREIALITDRPVTARERAAQFEQIRQQFGSQSQIKIENLHSAEKHPLLRHEEIGQVVSETAGTVVLDLQGDLWGDAAATFNKNIRRTRAAASQSLFRLSANAGAAPLSQNQDTDTQNDSYLIISSIYVPQVTFLGEETFASVEVSGRLPSNQKQQIELIVRSNTDLINTARRTVESDGEGRIRDVVKLPLSFLKAQTQVLTVTLQTPQALEPLNQASTTVFVAHSKTTALHVAVGPDWSLRNIRQKLKFWPNLDLLSYYILRERWDEDLVHTSQLSLIEFPSEKLFGEQLPNFHGIVAQNFYFDHYLRQEDALNLVNYVRAGGRMYIHPGPLSFLSDDPAINSIFPCIDKPQFTQTDRPLSWQAPRQSSIELPVELTSGLTHLNTSQYFAGCIPREDTYILAELSTGDPVLLASQLEKGLVVTSLSADWHTPSTRAPLTSATSIVNFNLTNASVEKLTQWIIEFLQRRQDSGLRPPDLLGPRIFLEDNFLPVRTRGAARQNLSVQLTTGSGANESGRALEGHIVTLPFLEKQGILLSAPISELLPSAPSRLNGNTSPTLLFQPINVSIKGNQKAIQTVSRGGSWPILERKDLHFPSNPDLLSSIPALGDPSPDNNTEHNTSLTRSLRMEQRPILEAYPWLFALGLALLALDTYLSRIARPSQQRTNDERR